MKYGEGPVVKTGTPYRFRKNEFTVQPLGWWGKCIIKDGDGCPLGYSKRAAFGLEDWIKVYDDENFRNPILKVKKEGMVNETYTIIDTSFDQEIGTIKRTSSSAGPYYWKIKIPGDDYCIVRWDKNTTTFSPKGAVKPIHFKGKIVGKIYTKVGLSGYRSRVKIDGDPDFDLDRRIILSFVLSFH